MVQIGMPPIETFMNISPKLRKEHLFKVLKINLKLKTKKVNSLLK